MVSLKQALIDNDSILLGKIAGNWQEAVCIAVAPLVVSGAVEERYAQAIIDSTEHYGPYYVLMPGMAMPHARPNDGVNRDAFSLVTLAEPVAFADGKEVSVLITLAATSVEVHTGVAIPQIVAMFEMPDVIGRLVRMTEVSQVLALIDEADISQYVTGKGDI
ncbi:PTS sugar transporter subunit IIA [Paenilisteria rocourtiae]|uniref:Ascorbate-specific PTS system EIIA component n=1 Tax=Listeria rocourtiae TaxID=647910 RepID=A0A4R6ZF43_9LIST|nr:PTS sugar transporter subunit IIA [Listeria rocourtiae]EUJ46170.1 PTS system ascorbate-specific transporter subunit IIA [Listeria rocourtiae FSL F6-920]MBC1606049.1 PTS transporter subunit EIIA [Listeria rocourtiae]TDR50484.1 PTS system IIA component (L-Asc family) [Listeria rocourtiae]